MGGMVSGNGAQDQREPPFICPKQSSGSIMPGLWPSGFGVITTMRVVLQRFAQGRRQLRRLRPLLSIVILLVFAPRVLAQADQPDGAAADAQSDAAPTIFPHSEDSRWFLGGQANIVLQASPAFHSAYSGPNSFPSKAQAAPTYIFTFYSGLRLTNTTEVLGDVEEALGGGIGGAVGIAGYTDLDAVRTVQGAVLAPTPYLARLMLHQIIPLSHERVPTERGPLSLFTMLPVRRIEFRIGKFTLPDFLDNNRGGSDDHLQFLNWTVVNDGAWDYAAQTRGYTDGALIEYDDRRWSVRFVEALMPKAANGIFLDADLSRAHSENGEAEFRGSLLRHRAGAVRLLAYENTAGMGNYEQAILNFEHGLTPTPNIVATRMQGRTRTGLGLNAEQELTPTIGIFGRAGWADGRNESFAYTEVDQSDELGAWFAGEKWHRSLDRVGAAFVTNGISATHREYLALGGLGFLLGDGKLNYSREDIVEAFYTAHLWRGVYGAFDLQYVQNPGYNRDRGPIVVPGLRLHTDF